MSYGIKVFNSSGGAVLDSTHSLGRVIGRINTGTTNGSYTYNGTVNGTFFASIRVYEGNTLRVKNGKAVMILYFSQFYEVST